MSTYTYRRFIQTNIEELKAYKQTDVLTVSSRVYITKITLLGETNTICTYQPTNK